MAREPTLLAHLLPRVTSRVEDAATDSLAFILNRSAACREALNRMLECQGFQPEPLVRVETQVAEDDESRPDMVGYDQKHRKCLLVEAKFWAGLQKDQATRYFERLDKDGPSVLMFICPSSRIETLWAGARRQMERGEDGVQLEKMNAPRQTRRARVIGANQHVMLTSWARLLGNMEAAVSADSAMASDIRQLRGLAKYQDEETFLPIHPSEFGLAFPRRMRGLNRLIDDIVNRGVSEEWMSTKRLQATATRDSYGRYVTVKDIPDGPLFICRNYKLWTTRGDTPLWLRISPKIRYDSGKLQNRIPSMVVGMGRDSVPINLRTGVERRSVLDDAFHQVKAITDIIKSALL